MKNDNPARSDNTMAAVFNQAEQGSLDLIELMGAAEQLSAAGLIDQTISLYRLWLANSKSPLAYMACFNLGVMLGNQQDFLQAESLYRKALEQNPGFVQARLNLGNCLEQQGRDGEAIEQWELVLNTPEINQPERLPLRLHALNNLGRLFETNGNYHDALTMLEKSFQLDSSQLNVLQHIKFLKSLNNTGSSKDGAIYKAEQGTLELVDLMAVAEQYKATGLGEKIITLYRVWLEHTTSPLAYIARFNLGVELAAAKKHSQAEEMYRSALEQNPDLVQARLNLGNCLEQLGREDEALEQWRVALAGKDIDQPDKRAFQLHALNNLGRLLETRKNYHEALIMLEKSFAIDPTQKDVLLHLVHLIQKMCKWPVYSPPKGVTKKEMINGTSPLAMLAAFDDPALQLKAAQQFIEHKYPVHNNPLASKAKYAHGKIRIGYLSSDLCLHAVSLLTVEMYELHDRDKFEVYGFCWSREDGTALRNRVISAMDHFIRIGNMSDQDAAECIRSHEIDILVDLQGLTSGARPLILSHRPAPLQITYLGFPGTTGLPWIDYVIADRYLIPEESLPYYSEKPLYVPCYQVSDNKRDVGPLPSRAAYSLPEDAFVFCSFNNNYKYTQEMFTVWMHILKRVPKSVLWLLADNEWAKDNLITAAKKLGIRKDRLIFAPREAPANYQARYQLADLFLDTFPFNGGTTANDALFMGLPLLTLSGRTFASRMAGSLLKAVNQPELITNNLKDYENKAVFFGQNRQRVESIKKQLKENHSSCTLFNVEKTVQDIEEQFCRLIDELPVVGPPSIVTADLRYIETPNAAPNFNVPQNTSDRRYVIVAPPYQHTSAGVRVLYELQKWLVRAGLDAIVCTWYSGYPVEQFADDIVIYPEVAPGNILNAKRVIRYILNVPGKLGHGEKQFAKSEVLISYNKELASYSNGKILQVPTVEAFFRDDGTPKNVNAVYVGKGQDLGLHPADSVYITKAFPATRLDVARLLRRVKTLYMYDDFSMIAYEAELCGCEVLLIGKDGTTGPYPRLSVTTIDEFKVQLHQFIEMTKSM